ncbi:hypothetical protein [Saccharothrix coeruleofusca]|nr:hypothetical protein [Saccharothrix coeruleofusca]MBP2340067.1 hypothetical protein [Saccharothrix coeruleofusca]
MTHPEAPQYYPPQPAPPKPAKFGALAWTALILGIVGVVGSPIIILNNLTAIVAGVGLVLGVIALFGTRKVLAIIGVVLCVAGIAFTVAAQAAAVKELDEIINGSTNQGQVSEGSGQSAAPEQAAQPPAAQTPSAETPTWGKRYTWKDGLAVEISAPAACTPGQFSAPQDVARAVKFTVTVVNGTDKPFEAGLLTIGDNAQFDGRTAEKIFDSSGGCGGGLDSATILPGKTYTYEVSYAVGAQPGEMQIALQPTFGADKAVFVGQA